MTKLEAIQGLLSGSLKQVSTTTFGKKEFLFLDKDTIMKHTEKRNIIYSDSSTNLQDMSWSIFTNNWFMNISNVGILVLVNNSVKRAMSYSNDNDSITFDDNSQAPLSDCSLLTQSEFESLYEECKLYI